jgi:hypothetical protein
LNFFELNEMKTVVLIETTRHMKLASRREEQLFYGIKRMMSNVFGESDNRLRTFTLINLSGSDSIGWVYAMIAYGDQI